MANLPTDIERIFHANQLAYFTRQGDDGEPSWLLLFKHHAGVVVQLLEDGELLTFRSFPLLEMSDFSLSMQRELMRDLLHRNSQLLLGAYVADDSVFFSLHMSIEDGELTSQQIERCLSQVAFELASFKSRVAEVLRKHSQYRCGIVGEDEREAGDKTGRTRDEATVNRIRKYFRND